VEGGGTVAVGFLLVGVLAAFLVVGGWWCVVDGRGRWWWWWWCVTRLLLFWSLCDVCGSVLWDWTGRGRQWRGWMGGGGGGVGCAAGVGNGAWVGGRTSNVTAGVVPAGKFSAALHAR